MKIKLLRNLGTKDFPNCQHKEGDICEVDDDFAKRAISQNLAVQIVEHVKIAEPTKAEIVKPVEVKEVKQSQPLKTRN